MSRIRSLVPAGASHILTGDFNVDQTDEVYGLLTSTALLRDSYAIAERKLAPNGTFNAFDTELKTPSRIDHIFVSPTTVSCAMPCVPIATGRSVRTLPKRGAAKLPPRCA